MSQSEKFRDEINTGSSFKGDALLLRGINYQATLIKKIERLLSYSIKCYLDQVCLHKYLLVLKLSCYECIKSYRTPCIIG